MGGCYALLLEVPESIQVRVGALGEQSLPAGGYAYVGSALGSGGFSRIARHRRLASGDHDARHWHVDYLLSHPCVELDGVVAAEADLECALAERLGSGPVAGFGASDCDCRSHLVRRDSVSAMRRAVERAFGALL